MTIPKILGLVFLPASVLAEPLEIIHESENFWVAVSPNGASVQVSESGIGPVINAIDTDKDGTVDYLEYVIRPASKDRYTLVYDFELDGEIDQRFHYSKSPDGTQPIIEIWFQDRWFPLTREDDQISINVDGQSIKVHRDDKGKFVPGDA